MNENGFIDENVLQNALLKDYDPEIFEIIEKEQSRQNRSLELIASENFISVSVLQCLSSCLHNKYSEGEPGNRYYGGNEVIDEMERLCQKRCLQAFRLDPEKWGVNVQALSGSPANFIVYLALLKPHDRIMGLSFSDGGHFSHGGSINNIQSAASIFYDTYSYQIDPKTGLIDYVNLRELAKQFKPNLIIAGISSYTRHLDYAKFREIADEHQCYLHADMSHIAGLLAAGQCPNNPFDYADTVMTTTHKTLRGPRAALIFYRKNNLDFERKINRAVFPGMQGGPHNHTIAAIATAMLQAQSVEFKEYQKRVLKNAKCMAKELLKKGYKLVTGGTDVHMLVVDLRPKNVTGDKVAKLLEAVSIACNKNIVPDDSDSNRYSGIRIGSPALTSRGLIENDFVKVIEYLDEGICLCKEFDNFVLSKNLDEFAKFIETNENAKLKISNLKERVEKFSVMFAIPSLKYL